MKIYDMNGVSTQKNMITTPDVGCEKCAYQEVKITIGFLAEITCRYITIKTDYKNKHKKKQTTKQPHNSSIFHYVVCNKR